MAKVFVEPVGVSVEIDADETLLAALTGAAIAAQTDCAGRGTCGKCLVNLGAGELTPPTDVELQKISPERLAEGWRLACQAKPLTSRVSIEVRETRGRRQILTSSGLRHDEVRSPVTVEVATVPKATLEDARADHERVAGLLGVAQIPLGVLRSLPDVLRANRWQVQVVRYGVGDETPVLLDVTAPQAEPQAFGVAVDIGTSKVIAYLFDLLEGRLIDEEAIENPQMRFGEDIVTRITEAFVEGQGDQLAAAVRDGINELLQTLATRQEIDASRLYDMTIVGNTAMHHLALGLSPVGLGATPFAPALDEPMRLRAADLGLAMNPEGRVEFLPPIAGFVGSDCLAVIAATHLDREREPAMSIDIGTNTEIGLVHEGKVYVTSCASGPAFEGYQITCGMKATEGSIERVTFTSDGHPDTVRTIGDVEPLGICGSGVVDVLAGLVSTGVVDASGRMREHELVREGRHGREYVLAKGPNGDIVFTQHDVRALQLAKGAIAAGWSLLLASVGLASEDLRHVYVAGAFGNYLDLGSALGIGMLPSVSEERIRFVGNAAGVGAQMALIDERERRRMIDLRREISFLELATDARFHEVFAGEMAFAEKELV